MSSLTALDYTATQYALLSSTYAWVGKIAKGCSGVVVENLATQHGLMTAYGFFFIGAGAIGIPAILLILAPSGGGRCRLVTAGNAPFFVELRGRGNFGTVLTCWE
jgi:PAT family beta-lactamase induction signal transducer AmpG